MALAANPSAASNPSPLQVVVYIYFTRIIVYLLESTLPFQLIWLAAAASEAATLAFYVAAGVAFRSASHAAAVLAVALYNWGHVHPSSATNAAPSSPHVGSPLSPPRLPLTPAAGQCRRAPTLTSS